MKKVSNETNETEVEVIDTDEIVVALPNKPCKHFNVNGIECTGILIVVSNETLEQPTGDMQLVMQSVGDKRLLRALARYILTEKPEPFDQTVIDEIEADRKPKIIM